MPKTDEVAISPATSPSVNSSDTATRTYRFGSPKSYILKPGEHLHDIRENDQTLVSFAKRLSAMNVFDVFFDYTRVITRDASKAHHEFSKHEELNRYQDVRCFEETRVKVPHPDGHDYIHANYVDGFREEKRYIMTQAPVQSSVEQFWTMVWQEKATTVVSLSVIDGDVVPIYIPVNGGQIVKYGPFIIENIGVRNVRDTYDATMLYIKRDGDDKDKPPRRVLHIIFYSWPDKGTPSRPSELMNLVQDVNHNRERLIAGGKEDGWLVENEKTPIVIHCLAGVGRSGVYVALDINAMKMDYTASRGKVVLLDVRDSVERIRSQRCMAVQKPEQYLFLHLSVLEYSLRYRYFDDVSVVDVTRLSYQKDKE